MKESKKKRPSLPPVSEQMKAWSSALADEVGSWPLVECRSFFGFTALYRRDRIFAVLPRTRAMQTPDSLAFKLEAASPKIRARLERDPSIGFALMQMRGKRWFTFEIHRDEDLHDALDWLGRAYAAVLKSVNKPRKPR
ncbi:MAG TPA: hypothetical protein VKR60_10410 [Candidatus Sulfotelmatobacter sp.]|nr:hypothetical protein [Candidatus Sulfotelmatobacter sp.]